MIVFTACRFYETTMDTLTTCQCFKLMATYYCLLCALQPLLQYYKYCKLSPGILSIFWTNFLWYSLLCWVCYQCWMMLVH